MDNEPDIQAYRKLDESRFFLDLMTKASNDDEEEFFYSAFLTAWRSVLDVLLYDYAILFDLGFTRDDRMERWKFEWSAKRLKNHKAHEFYKWWDNKLKTLSENPLLLDRHFHVHRGYPEDVVSRIYVPTTITSSYATLLRFPDTEYEGRFPSLDRLRDVLGGTLDTGLVEECERSYSEMKKIVDESKRYAIVE